MPSTAGTSRLASPARPSAPPRRLGPHPYALTVVEPASIRQEGRFEVCTWPTIPGLVPGSGWVGLAVPVVPTARAPWLVNGWQSWSSARPGVVGEPTGGPGRLPAGISPRDPIGFPVRRATVSWGLAITEGIVAAVRGHDAAFLAEPRHGRLLVVCEATGDLPDVWVARTSDEADAATAEVLTLIGAGACRPRREPPLGVWCTWGGRWVGPDGIGGQHLDEAQLADALGRLAPLVERGHLAAAQVDDGWQRAIGDWTTGPRFPSGLTALAARMADAGLEPGLWLAPACAAPGSNLVVAHPDWVLRDHDDRPVVAATVPHWGGRVWALDTSRPDVLDHLTATAATLADAGFSYLKLDFLYAAALPGRRARPWTGAEATRAAIAAIRAGAPDAFLLGCGSPLWPAIGLVDAMRIGPDLTEAWDPRLPSGLRPGQQAGMRSAHEALRHRQALHGRLWTNDADHLLLREQAVSAGWDRQVEFADAVGASGTLLAFADRPQDVSERGWARWAALVEARRRDRAPGT